MIVTATAARSVTLPVLISGLRTLGNDTPILNSWAGDGTYWVTKDPQVTDYCFVTYASIFGDDPNAAVNASREAGEGRHRRLRHRLGRDRRRRRGDQARQLHHRRQAGRRAREVPEGADPVGLVSFSPQLHSVFGRQYRVIKIQNNAGKLVGTVTAKVVPKI